MKVLITGAAGNAGRPVARLAARAGYDLRLADGAGFGPELRELGECVRCDTRTPDDARRAVDGMDLVVHLAAWHPAHDPPVSEETIFAVNVGGTFNVLQAAREAGVRGLVFGSSMAYGYGDVYAATKVLGEDLCTNFHEMTGAPVAMLRYHAFVPGPYLEYGARLLRNGVDRSDVAAATVAALEAVAADRVSLFCTIVHTDHGMPPGVIEDFRSLGPDWCEERVPGAASLIRKYDLQLPEKVERHDLSEAKETLGWEPRVGFADFLRALAARDARGEDVRSLTVPGELPDADRA